MTHSASRFAPIALFATWLLQASAAAAAMAPAAPLTPLPDLDPILESAMEGSLTPAIGVVVLRDGKIEEIRVRGLRRNDGAQAVQPDDVWLIGSTGKPMTAALIAKLVDRGTLSWDATLAQMLPDLADKMRPEYRAVTLLQLLSHRSGLPENLLDLKALDAFFVDTRPLPQQRLALVTAALQDPPAAVPGSEFVYSNSGFLIAAVVAERATATDFEDLMRQEVFAPLGMTSVGFGSPPPAQTQGHRNGRPVGAAKTNEDGVPDVYTAAGNFHMNLHDWAQFCLDQLAGSRGTGKLLTPASYRLMQAAQPGSGSGLDWGVQESIAGRAGPVLVHGGSDGNWLAWAVLFPTDGTGVLVIANAAGDMGAEQATMGVLGTLFPALAPAVAEAPSP